MEKLIAWIVTFITAQAPPGLSTLVPESKESKEAALARYESIAKDIATIVTEEEPLFKGPLGRSKTVSIILSIMTHESMFRKDVDLGLGKWAKGDGGKSVCLMQLNIGDSKTWSWNTVKNRAAFDNDDKSEVVLGWDAKEILADRKKCIRAGYRVIKNSFSHTSHLPTLEWLRVYASGSPDKGSKESVVRMGLALKWFKEHKPDFVDADFLGPEPMPALQPIAPVYGSSWVGKSHLIRVIHWPE